MLYFFNSAYRPLYTRNVLNTLFLPRGCTNEYRYKHTGDPRYIPASLFAGLQALPAQSDCVIIFIDRFGPNGYTFHPLRFGKYVLNRDVNQYIHFRVSLDQFVYPRERDSFNRSLVQALGPFGLPSLTGGDPRNTHDGYYAIQSETVFGNNDEFQTGEIAWNSAVEALSQTTAFATNNEQSPLFLRLEIQTRKRKILTPVLRQGAAQFDLTRDEAIDGVLTYRFPRQLVDQNSRGKVEIKFGDNLRPLSNPSILVDSHANSLTLPFVSKRYVEDTAGSIEVSSEAKAGEPELLVANSSIQYRLSEPSTFWLQIAVALIALAIVGALLVVDFSKLPQPSTFSAIFHATWRKAALALLQAACLYWLFRLVGKKVL